MRDLLLRFDHWPRRILAGVLLLLAAVTAAGGRRATAAPAGVRKVVAAARDLPSGAVLSESDLTLLADAAAPRSAYTSISALVGRRIAGAIDRGEAITGARLLGAGLTTGLLPGQLGVAVAVSATGSGLLARAGDTVELIAAAATPGADPDVVAPTARVLAAIPPTGNGQFGGSQGVLDGQDGQLVVAVDQAAAIRLAAVSTRSVLAAVIDDP